MQNNLTENDVSELLAHIPPPVKGTNSRDEWLKVIAATCAALDGNEAAALSLLTNWDPPWEKNAYETAIKSLRGNYKCTAGTLVFLASQNGYNASEKARERAARDNTPAPKPAPKPAASKPKKPAERKQKENTLSARVILGKCSIVESCRKPESIKETDLLACLRAIKAGKWKNEVAAVRNGTREKSTLPQICAFGVYSARRADENLITKSGFLVLDFDGKDNKKTDFRTLRERLARLPFTLAVFSSPSGNGLKALIRVPDSVNDSEAFTAAASVLAPLGGKLDAGSEARKHFIVSDDSEAFINETPLDEITPLDAWENLPPSALAVLFAETFDRFYFAGKEDYFFKDESGTIKALTGAAAAQEFEFRHGANRKTARAALYAVRRLRYVHRVFPALSCHSAGLHTFDRKPALVLSSPEIIEADEGNFPTIKTLLETVFSDFEQLARFLAWLQHARRAFLRACESNGASCSPLPLLMLLGTAGAGKDLIFQTIIRPALGDRQHASADTFPQEKQWLGAIIGSECVLASEMQDLNTQERSRFKATIKQIIGGSGYNAESKGKDSFTFRGQHFLTLLANIDENGNCARACPEISGDFTDKFVALALDNAAAVKAAFDGSHARENAAAIRRELPAFLYWLDVYFETPQEWKDARFGVAGYCAPAARRALFEVSIDFDVLAKIDELAAADKTGDFIEKPYTAARLATILADFYHEKPLSPRVIGSILRRLARENPQKISWNGSDSSPKYRVHRPRSAPEAAAESSPPQISPFGS